MELRVLRYFLTAAERESITGAAEALHLTQPTLSRQLMDLEEELGKQLLIRGNRKLTLTEDGVLFRRRAEEILSLVEKTKSEMKSSDEMISGDIRIGGSESEASHLIAKTIRKLQPQYPQIQYYIYSRNAVSIMEQLDKGLLDFGFVLMPADLTKYDYIQLPCTDSWGILMRSDCPLAGKEFVTAKDLLEIPLILPLRLLIKNEIAGWLGEKFDSMNVVAHYNLLYNASFLVTEGVGCALCLNNRITTIGNGELCFRPLKPALTTGSALIWKKYQPLSKAAEKFLQQIQSDCAV